MSNKRISISLAFLFLLNFTPLKSNGQSQPKIINKLLEGIGGKRSLNEARYIMFTCTNDGNNQISGEHTYIYDREANNVRFEGKTNEGNSLVALFNSQKNSGKLFLNNEIIQESELLDSIIQQFNKDAYLLFTPILLANNILNPTLQDSVIIDLKRYFVLGINASNHNFESAKLYIDSQSGLLKKLETFNEDNQKTHEFFTSKIKDVGGGLILATQFTDKMSGSVFQYPVVAAFLNVENSKFNNL